MELRSSFKHIYVYGFLKLVKMTCFYFVIMQLNHFEYDK